MALLIATYSIILSLQVLPTNLWANDPDGYVIGDARRNLDNLFRTNVELQRMLSTELVPVPSTNSTSRVYDGVSLLPFNTYTASPNFGQPTAGGPSIPGLPTNIQHTDCSYAGRLQREPWLRGLTAPSRDPANRPQALVCQDLMAAVCSETQPPNGTGDRALPRLDAQTIFDQVKNSYLRLMDRWMIPERARSTLRTMVSQTQLMNEQMVRRLNNRSISEAFGNSCGPSNQTREMSAAYTAFLPGHGSIIFICPHAERTATNESLEITLAHELTHVLRDFLPENYTRLRSTQPSAMQLYQLREALDSVFTFRETSCGELFRATLMPPRPVPGASVSDWLMRPRASLVGNPRGLEEYRIMTSSDPSEVCLAILSHQSREAIPDAVAGEVFSEMHRAQFESYNENERITVLRRALDNRCQIPADAELHWMMPYPTPQARMNRLIAGSRGFRRLMRCPDQANPALLRGSRRRTCSLQGIVTDNGGAETGRQTYTEDSGSAAHEAD